MMDSMDVGFLKFYRGAVLLFCTLHLAVCDCSISVEADRPVFPVMDNDALHLVWPFGDAIWTQNFGRNCEVQSPRMLVNQSEVIGKSAYGVAAAIKSKTGHLVVAWYGSCWVSFYLHCPLILKVDNGTVQAIQNTLWIPLKVDLHETDDGIALQGTSRAMDWETMTTMVRELSLPDLHPVHSFEENGRTDTPLARTTSCNHRLWSLFAEGPTLSLYELKHETDGFFQEVTYNVPGVFEIAMECVNSTLISFWATEQKLGCFTWDASHDNQSSGAGTPCVGFTSSLGTIVGMAAAHGHLLILATVRQSSGESVFHSFSMFFLLPVAALDFVPHKIRLVQGGFIQTNTWEFCHLCAFFTRCNLCEVLAFLILGLVMRSYGMSPHIYGWRSSVIWLATCKDYQLVGYCGRVGKLAHSLLGCPWFSSYLAWFSTGGHCASQDRNEHVQVACAAMGLQQTNSIPSSSLGSFRRAGEDCNGWKRSFPLLLQSLPWQRPGFRMSLSEHSFLEADGPDRHCADGGGRRVLLPSPFIYLFAPTLGRFSDLCSPSWGSPTGMVGRLQLGDYRKNIGRT